MAEQGVGLRLESADSFLKLELLTPGSVRLVVSSTTVVTTND